MQWLSLEGQWPPCCAVDTLPFILCALIHGWDWPTLGSGHPAPGVLFKVPQGKSISTMNGPGGEICVGPGLSGTGPQQKSEG